jgi:polyphenol oxidase
MSLFVPDWSLPAHVHARFSTRGGGVSQSPYDSLNLGDHVGDDAQHVSENRHIVRAQLPGQPLWLKQTHGTEVSTPSLRALHQQGPIEADAAITNIPNEVLAVMTADCLPVLLSSMDGVVIGVAHAGWRGLSEGILENAVAKMMQLIPGLKAREILAWMGPAIGPKFFEVGEDVVKAFCSGNQELLPESFIPIAGREGKFLANLYLLAQYRLLALGVKQISGGTHCTYQEKDRFFSYRRDGQTGRFGSFIWISR